MEVIAVAAGALLLIGFICGYIVRELSLTPPPKKGQTTTFRTSI
jgi:hypothetical protein